MKKRNLFPLALCLTMLMLLTLLPARAEEEGPEAEDITRGFTFVQNSSEINALYSHDGKYVTHNTYKPGDTLYVRPRARQIIGSLFFRLGSEKAKMTLRQYDQQGQLLLSSDLEANSLCYAAIMEEGCSSVEITAREEAFDICELTILGPGRLPDSFPQPEASVTRTDLLIVTTHPDDEWIFLGAVYPIYVAEQGYTGTFGGAGLYGHLRLRDHPQHGPGPRGHQQRLVGGDAHAALLSGIPGLIFAARKE